MWGGREWTVFKHSKGGGGGGLFRGMNPQALGFCKSDEAVAVMKAASLCKKI